MSERAGFCSTQLEHDADDAVSLRVVLSSHPSLRKSGCSVQEHCQVCQGRCRANALQWKPDAIDVTAPLSTLQRHYLPASFILHTRNTCCMPQSRRLACAQAQNPRWTPAHTMRNMCTGKRDTADKTESVKHPRHLTGVRSALTILA